MIVDCDTCEVRGDACRECVITVLLGAPPGEIEFDGTEQRALDSLADAGLVPHLQLVPPGCGERGKPAERCAGGAGRSVRQVG